MFIESDLPKCFWVEVVSTTCDVINRCLIISILKNVSYKLLKNKKLNLSHFKPFKCKLIIAKKLRKFDQ